MSTLEQDRLHHLFACLKDRERKRFPGWLHNELQGQQQSMWEWFEQIWPDQPYEQAWQQLRPNEVLDRAQINQWNTALIGWMEHYLSICAFREDSFARIHYLNRAVIRRNPLMAYASTIRKSRKLLHKQSIRDHTYYRVQHELDRLDREFHTSYPGIEIRRYNPDPDSILQHEELTILLANVEVAVRRLSLSTPLTDWDQSCIDRLGAYKNIVKWPVAYLYCILVDYVDTTRPMSLEEAIDLTTLYQQHYSKLRPDAQFSVFILINNLLVRAYFKRKEAALVKQAFEINIWILQHTHIFGARYFYRNVIQLSLLMARQSNTFTDKQRHLQQAHGYLKSLKPTLPPEDREEAYQYNLAYLYFEEKQFENLSKQLYAFQFKDYTYEISYLILWNKAQFERGKWEGLIERLKNIQISLKQTKKLSPHFKKRQLNQVKYFRKLVSNYRPTILKRLRDQLLQETEVQDKDWLLQKLDEKIG